MLFLKKRALSCYQSRNLHSSMPPIFVTFGNDRLWKDARLLVLPTYWARAQRVKRRSVVGGWVCSLQVLRGLVKIEIRSNNVSSDWLSYLSEGFQASDFRTGFIVSLLLGAQIVCYPLSFAVNTVKENGKYVSTHFKAERCIYGALTVHGSVFTFTE